MISGKVRAYLSNVNTEELLAIIADRGDADPLTLLRMAEGLMERRGWGQEGSRLHQAEALRHVQEAACDCEEANDWPVTQKKKWGPHD